MRSARSVPDQAARDRIERGLDTNLLVEGGAGSGKTESFVRRMASGSASCARRWPKTTSGGPVTAAAG